MTEYISSFPPGFERLVRKELPARLPGVRIQSVYSGLVRYAWKGKQQAAFNVPYFGNTFQVLRVFSGKDLDFRRMVDSVVHSRGGALCVSGGKTFRIRFSRENAFCKVDASVQQTAERAVLSRSRMQLDRVHPGTELWYLLRSEGIGFYAQLLQKRKATEKQLHPGQLRPELAALLCAAAEVRPIDTVCDPFAGYGSIPMQLLEQHRFHRLYVFDIDEEKIALLRKNLHPGRKDVTIAPCDALRLDRLDDSSVDAYITDPPWGYYEQIDDIAAFYAGMLAAFAQKAASGARIVLLSARKEELTSALHAQNAFSLSDRYDILVNGKKAAVFVLRKKD